MPYRNTAKYSPLYDSFLIRIAYMNIGETVTQLLRAVRYKHCRKGKDYAITGKKLLKPKSLFTGVKQRVSGGIVNILGIGSMDYSE